MTALAYTSLLAATNVRAALRVIREGESNQTDDGPHSGYRAMYHPSRRLFYEGELRGAPHPRRFEYLPDGSGRKSSAFGAYQFVATTWDEIGKRYALQDDIAPYSQDCYAVALIHYVGALDDVIDGRFDEWIKKCGTQWASLPHSPLSDGGSKVAYARAADVWKRYGGSVPHIISIDPSDRPDPAPVEDRSTEARPEDVARINAAESPQPEDSMSPFLFAVPLIQSLIEAFSPLARAKVTKALDKQGMDPASSGAVADNLMGIIKGLASQGLGVTVGPAGTPAAAPPAPSAAADPVIAVATVKSDARLLAQAEMQFTDYLDKIAPMIDRIEKMEQAGWAASEESMDRAASRAQSQPDGGQDKLLTWGILGFTAVVLLALAGGLVALIAFDKPYDAVLALFSTAVGVVLGKFGTRYDHRYGSSRQSQAKDVTIAELSSRRNP